MPELRWYGWGDATKTYSLEHRPGAWSYLRAVLDLRGDQGFPACYLDSIELRAPRLADAQLSRLQALVGADAVKTDKRTRVLHSYGKSCRDLVRLRAGEIPNPPDAVVYPADEDQVARVVRLCVQEGIALVPFGGGSSVVGGVEPLDERITVTLDLARMNRVLSVDQVSRTATIEAGISGPDLERELNERGFTLGHSPQSFEFSTLGGWIATRGAGLASTRYGKIEAMTLSVRVATPRGMVETRPVPASAAGPSLLQLLIGSEGTLGVITRATMRLNKVPQVRDYRALLFKGLPQGLSAIRAMLQAGIVPATVRLSDEDETRSFFALRERSPRWKGLIQGVGLRALSRLGYTFEHGALMILGFEGDPSPARPLVEADRSGGLAVCKSFGAVDLGHGIARTWLVDRYQTPYLRDVLMDHGVLTDTLETATTWDNVESLHGRLAKAIADASIAAGSPALVMTHVSHCYREGASLYVTFLVRMVQGQAGSKRSDAVLAQWHAVKRAATECIMTNGGTLSHHHGIGYEHAPWMETEVGRLGLDVLGAAKAALDPGNIMNPGKLTSSLQAPARELS